MTFVHRSMFASLSLLVACSSSSSSQSQNPDAGVYDEYYSEKSGGGAGGSDEAASDGERPAPRTMSSTKRADRRKGIPKALASQKPPVEGGKKTREPKKPANLPDVKLAGFLPTIAAAGSVVEVYGEGLDRKGLQVLVGAVPQKVTERSPDRVLFTVRGGEGPVGLAPPQSGRGKTPALLARSQTEFHFISTDSPFGKPRTRPGNGLIGNVYQVSGEPGEVPDFDTLGAPVGVIAVDNLDFTGSASGGLAGMDGWYAIHFRGSFNVVAEGDYDLCLNAGDGALLFLDQNLVVDNDGRHEAKEACESIFIEPGEYQLDLLWFQDDNPEMALQFLWAKDGGAKEPVPPEALFPPEDIEAFVKP